MTLDLTAAAHAIRSGAQRAEALLEASLAHADEAVNRHTFIRRFPLLAPAHDAQQPLAGLAISIKDLFDVQGHPTTAGSRVLAGSSPATADAPAVARLRSAGAALIGHTNLSEFAFSGVGINPHHGTPCNVATARMDPTPRVPGGSTSGGATSVASGAAWAALGSDTGGSIRIPAALQGLVGFKGTARLVPTDGCIPLSTTLDTACAITLSVRDAQLLHEVLAARRVSHACRPLNALHLALPTMLMLDGLDATVARAFERAIARLRRAGAHIDEIAMPELQKLASLNAGGGFAAPESWAWHRRLLTNHEAQYDPRVAKRIRRGEGVSAADYIDLVRARQAWIARTQDAVCGYDAMLSPTVPIVAPPLAPLIADDEAFFSANTLLLRNPAAINFLDGCALSLPCQAEGELPVGLMVWAQALADDRVLEVSLAVEAALRPGGH
jgi:amidase/aspartyl-tRNA(Asn)/glutamyl-tRNA(Gln) amidotransferase subunit A